MERNRLDDYYEVLTTLEVARVLRVSKAHVADLVREGHLPKIEGIGNVIRIPRAAVQRLLEAAQ